MNKIIFLDVDGTLINYEAIMPKSAGLAVDLARANGHKVYICTGCSKAEILQKNLCDLDGMIGGNGAYVESNGQVILHQVLSVENVKEIVDWCNEKKLGFYLETNNGLFCNKFMLTQGPQTLKKYSLGKGANIADAERSAQKFLSSMTLIHGKDLYRNDVMKISFILSEYKDYIEAKNTFHHLEVNTWGGKGEIALFGDLGPSNVTKQNGIKALLNYLNINQKDTISFGDAKIDLSMFECCAYNVAMGNGGKEIKAAADYITTDVNDNGIYNAFKYLNLIE